MIRYFILNALLFFKAILVIKIQLLWGGHTNLRNLPHGFDIWLVDVNTMRMIAQIFVPFNKRPNLFSENYCYLILIHVLTFTQGYLNIK